VPQFTTRGLWDDLSQQIFDFLADITLQELVERGGLGEAAQKTASSGAMSGRIRDRAA